MPGDITETINNIKAQYGVVGMDEALNKALDVALRVAKTDYSVLITGESGVGKDVLPRIIHDYSANKKKPYLAINCGAIPEGTVDSELFGHVKGAFTGADSDHIGYFEMADGGTLFLDEVGDLPMATQTRLLRVLENREFIRVGSTEVRKTNVRIVAATNVNLNDRIMEGKFRLDLYHRLNNATIRMPALRERKGDIELLFMKFAAEYSIKNGAAPIELEEDAKRMMVNYSWPGNIRQLKHVVNQISIMEDERRITAARLAPYLQSPFDSALPAIPHKESDRESVENLRREMAFIIGNFRREIEELRYEINVLKGAAGKDIHPKIHRYALGELGEDVQVEISRTAEIPTDEAFDTSEVIEEGDLNVESMEMEAIRKALQRHNGNRDAAASELGISTRTLYRKLKKFNLE